MVSFFKRLSNIPTDKLLHSFYGTLVYALVSLVDFTLALWITLLVAVSKEVYDFKVKGKFSFADIVATIGIALVLWVGSIWGL